MTKSKTTTKTTTKTTPKSSIIADIPVISPKKVSSKPLSVEKPKTVIPKTVTIISPPPVIEETKTEIIQTNPPQTPINLISFYGHNIRSVYTKNQWYFCLEDILKIANIIDPTKFLIDLKNQTELKDNYYQFVDSFSYQENNNPIVIPVVNFQSFINLLPYIRQIGSVIPGPFPEWLKNMANRRL